MGLFSRFKDSTVKNPDRWLIDALDAAPSITGECVSEESAMRIAAVYACVRVISETISTLPLFTYRETARGREKASDDPAYQILHLKPNAITTSSQLRAMLAAHLCLNGNAYCEILRDSKGALRGLWPINPAAVSVKLTESGSLEYHISTLKGQVVLPSEDMLHFRGLVLDPGNPVGLSPISYARETLGAEMAARRYSAEFYRNGAAPGVVLMTEKRLDPDIMERLRVGWKIAYGREGGNRRGTAILEEGLKAEKLSLSQEDSQFIETRKLSRSEIAGIFRVPPHMIGDLDKATFSNIEHQSLQFVRDCIRPLCVSFEQELNAKLFPRGDLFAEHVLDGLLRGDTKSRYEGYAIARQWGWMSANDIRALENLNPISGGDTYLSPLNMNAVGGKL